MSNPKWDKSAPVVPVNATTHNMMSYPDWNHEWSREYDFESEMKLVDWGRGRSSVTFYLENDEGRRFPMFASDFYWVVRNRSITNGVVEKTWWTFTKSGANYGIKLK